MPHQRVKLSKKLFMTLKPGQYIMGNFFPMKYQEIGSDLNGQWENWRGVNGNSVDIFDTQEECLQMWWSMNSGLKVESKSKSIYNAKLSKKVFMAQSDGYYLLFTQDPFDYFKFTSDRENQWQEYKHANGRCVRIYKNQADCILSRARVTCCL